LQNPQREAQMLQIRRILCPIDFSETSRHAWDHAVAVAGWYGSRITALHVCHHELPIEAPPFVPRPVAALDLTTDEREDVTRQFQPWLTQASTAGVEAEFVLDIGASPAAPILARAASLPADLIAIGTHGLQGVERFLLGSVTEKVLRKSTCPVLTVPPPAISPAKPPYKRLLCPIDFSPSSITALTYALGIAKESDSQLTVLHVLDWPTEDDLFIERVDTPELRRESELATRRRIDALISEDARTWCDPATVIRHGKPYQAILERAAEERAELIVMGVRGRNQVNMMLFGSTTNQVVRQATCPVLTLKS
jgi:nucleotide-binding universal stress UspA family protein